MSNAFSNERRRPRFDVALSRKAYDLDDRLTLNLRPTFAATLSELLFASQQHTQNEAVYALACQLRDKAVLQKAGAVLWRTTGGSAFRTDLTLTLRFDLDMASTLMRAISKSGTDDSDLRDLAEDLSQALGDDDHE